MTMESGFTQWTHGIRSVSSVHFQGWQCECVYVLAAHAPCRVTVCGEETNFMEQKLGSLTPGENKHTCQRAPRPTRSYWFRWRWQKASALRMRTQRHWWVMPEKHHPLADLGVFTHPTSSSSLDSLTANLKSLVFLYDTPDYQCACGLPLWLRSAGGGIAQKFSLCPPPLTRNVQPITELFPHLLLLFWLADLVVYAILWKVPKYIKL